MSDTMSPADSSRDPSKDPLPPGQLPEDPFVFTKTDPTKDKPPLGDSTSRQAMLFEPSNAAVMTGIVGLGLNGGYDSNWDWYRRNTDSHSGPPSTPAPGMFSEFSIGGLPVAWPGMYSYFRRILNDPTVRYVRALALAPILATQWSVKAGDKAPGEAREAIDEMIQAIRPQFLDDAVRAIDYGWAGFEQCFEMVDGLFYLTKLKALIHDLTSIYVENNGQFAGFNNNGTLIDPVKALLHTYDGESGNLYGRGRCNNLLEVCPWWRDANEGAARYDRKIAGVFLIIHYPPGQSVDKDGKVTENHIIAKKMLDAAAAGKPMAVCNEFAGEMENTYLTNISMADRTRWKIELLEDKGSRQPGFGDRLAYLDRQKARAYYVPERSAFEAQKSGSRADSESHGELILTEADIINARLAGLLNGSKVKTYSPINNILRMNWGDKAVGTVRIEPVPIDEAKKKFIRDICAAALASKPALLPRVSGINDLFEQAGLPIPSNPLDDEKIQVELDGMVAAEIPKPPGEMPPGKDGDKATMSRLLDLWERRISITPSNSHNGHPATAV